VEAPPAGPRVGEVYLRADEIAARVAELGAEIATDYEGLEPLLVAPLKASLVFTADLSRATPIIHHLDFVELAGYDGGNGGSIKLLKDLDAPIAGRHVLVVEDVIDTGLTLNYLCKTLSLRGPATLHAVTLLDRPYRRIVENLPMRYVGFTAPDEFFVGYGFDMQERYRNLPDLHVASS
jgi:hypoxanthine phosphoribosyltransferase